MAGIMLSSRDPLNFIISLLTHLKLSNLISSGQEYAGKRAIIRGKDTDLQHLVISEAQILPPWPISSHQLVTLQCIGKQRTVSRFSGTTTWHQHSTAYLWALKAARAWCGGTPESQHPGGRSRQVSEFKPGLCGQRWQRTRWAFQAPAYPRGGLPGLGATFWPFHSTGLFSRNTGKKKHMAGPGLEVQQLRILIVFSEDRCWTPNIHVAAPKCQ